MRKASEVKTPAAAKAPKQFALLIDCNTGKEAVVATQIEGTNGTFAYFTDRENRSLYSVTHIPSGAKACAVADIKSAEELGVALFEAMGKNAKSKDAAVAASLVPKIVTIAARAISRAVRQ